MRNKEYRKRKGPSRYPWGEMQHRYVTSPEGDEEVTYERLCTEFGCKMSRLGQVAGKNGWTEKREEYRQNSVKIAIKKSEETAGQRLHRHTQYMKLVQATAGKAMVEGKTIPAPRDGIEAVKTERVLYGETSEHIKLEGIPDDESEAILRVLAEVRRRKRREQMGLE